MGEDDAVCLDFRSMGGIAGAGFFGAQVEVLRKEEDENCFLFVGTPPQKARS